MSLQAQAARMAVRAVGIEFGDNDFRNTFRGLLGLIRDAIWHTEGAYTREEIANAINELSFGCYLLFQRRRPSEEDDDRIRRYLQVKLDQVLLNEEVDAHLNDPNLADSWNGEFFFMYVEDLERTYAR